MKIIHTFLPLTPPKINKKTIYHMTLSVLLAKKFYDKVVLYTNIETAEIVRQIGLPYDEVNTELLEGVETRTFSIPKLIVYAAQKEPFIHIDLDTFLFKKIEFNKLNSIYSTYNEGLNDTIKVSNTGLGFFNTYIKHTFEIKDKLPEDFILNIDFSEIPNMCVFGGYHYNLIAKASEYCLNLYYDNREHFDKNYYNACIIEQLFIPSAIRLLSSKNENFHNFKFKFLYKRVNPSKINFLFDSTKFPLEIDSFHEKIVIENESDLYKRTTYNFNGFLHLCGSKYYDNIMYIVRTKIIFDFKGINFINKIDEIFSEKLVFEKTVEHYEEMKNLLNKKRNIM